MLTIKENAALISGLPRTHRPQTYEMYHTGNGKNRKILVNKADLIAYFNGVKM